MRKSGLLTTLILGVSALLATALVGVLYLQLRAPDEEPDAAFGRLARPTAARRGQPELPEPDAPATGGTIAAAPQDVQAPPPERLGPAMIVGRVVDARSGEPITGFRIDVLGAEPGSPLERLLASHDRGERSRPFQTHSGVFRLDRQPGHWDLVVRSPGYLPAELSDIVVPSTDGQPTLIRMDPGPTLTGLVYDVDGSPVPDVPVFLHVTHLDAGGDPPELSLATTGPDGRFRFSALPAGTYALTLLELENPVDRMGGIQVQTSIVDVSIPLSPRHHVVISVRDGQGNPVRDALVELRSVDGSDGYASGSTLPSGQVTLRHLIDGDYTLRVARDGYADAEERLALGGGSGQMVRWVTLQPSGAR